MEKTINSKKHFFILRLTAVSLVMIMAFGLVPANAKSKKTKNIPSIKVSSIVKLIKQLNTDGAGKLIFTTDVDLSISIPSTPYSEKKQIVINAPNAAITNKAKFVSVTINEVREYTENVSGNEITVNAQDSIIIVNEKMKVAKLTVNSDNVQLSVKKTGKIENLDIKQNDEIKMLVSSETNDITVLSREEYEKYLRFSEAIEVYDLANSVFYKEIDPDIMAEYAARGVLAGLDDPYSFYYNPEEYASMWEDDEGNYDGIGVLIQSNYSTQTCTIIRVFEGSPALEAGVQRGDILYKVGDDLYVTADNLNEAVKIMKGFPGTDVDVTFLRNGKEITYTITRGPVNVNEVKSTMINKNIGYIALYQFAGRCELEFESALNNLLSQGAEGIILDLRDNTGGWVDQALYIADLFMDEGNLCYLVYKDGEKHYDYPTTAGKTDVKLVILINENSASSSEILTGALRDCADASTVGVKSFGKGIIQGVYSVGTRGAGAQITLAQDFTPNGDAVHGIGITPEYIVELPEGDLGMYQFADTKNDIQLKKAIEVMKKKLK